MATKPLDIVYEPSRGVVICTWAQLLNGDDGAPFNSYGYALGSVQWVGTIGANFAGQTEVTNRLTLSNFTAVTALAASAVGVFFPTGNKLYVTNIRPRVSAGDATTNVTCIMLFVKH